MRRFAVLLSVERIFGRMGGTQFVRNRFTPNHCVKLLSRFDYRTARNNLVYVRLQMRRHLRWLGPGFEVKRYTLINLRPSLYTHHG